jgi:uridine kinase
VDAYDAICDHLLVIDHDSSDGQTGRPTVVGTYRLLRQPLAEEYGGFYSAGEFDIGGLIARHSRLQFLELGRSCVLGSYRNKRTVELLWYGIHSYVLQNRIDVMIGCASLDGTEPKQIGLALSFLHHYARAPEEWRARALPDRYVEMNRLSEEAIDPKAALRALPPLIKGYLRLGAFIGDGAVVDYEFGTTDGFLYPNAVLEREGLMEKKGFPESYDLPALLRFLTDVKAGRRPARAPIYSHLIYDVIPNQWVEVDRPDILVVEGLNVLQTGRLPKDGQAIPFVSDFFDFSVYLDADEGVLKSWYVGRFLTLRETAFRDPKSYFHRYSNLSDEEAIETATTIWSRINLLNLHENILPTRQRADLILKKSESHQVEEVWLRRL